MVQVLDKKNAVTNHLVSAALPRFPRVRGEMNIRISNRLIRIFYGMAFPDQNSNSLYWEIMYLAHELTISERQ